MIRYINLTGQIAPDDDLEFAWYDTITDEFMRYGDSVTWTSFQEFESDLLSDLRRTHTKEDVQDEMLGRFRNLDPAIQISPDGNVLN